jgi:hypothetical protein
MDSRASATRTVLKWVLIALATVALVGVMGHFEQAEMRVCRTCFSRWTISQNRFGAADGPSVALGSRREEVALSHFHREFLAGEAEHAWDLAHRNESRFFRLVRSCSLGRGAARNALLSLYEASEDFRAFIRSRIAAGHLSRERFIELASAPMTEPGPAQAGAALIQAFADDRGAGPDAHP